VNFATPDTNSATIVRASYFEVQGGAEWAKITDLKIWTYGTTSIELYYKYGTAVNYEHTPCAWKKVAETSESWNGGYWKRNVSPPWINGFEPVVLPPNEKVSFYIVNVGSSYGILGKSYSSSLTYSTLYQLDAASPVGAVTMSYGLRGYNDQRFKAYPTYYSGHSIYGTIVLETMKPGSTQSPTAAPTTPSTPGTIERSITGVSSDEFNGLQFDIENLGSSDVIVTKFSVLFSSSGTKNIEIWMRNGSHEGSSSGCENWNNWCGAYTKVASGSVYSSGSSYLTHTPEFGGIVPAGGIASFAIVSGNSLLLTEPTTDVLSNDILAIKPASPIEDHYGNSVQTTHALSSTKYLFQGIAHYDIAHSNCAVLNVIGKDWVKTLDQVGGASAALASVGDDGDIDFEYEAEEIVHFNPDASGGGGLEGDGSPREFIE
jgi:hypothetical protein